MKTLYLDIETIPSQKPGLIDEIRETIKPPGNIKKQESIDNWLAENADEAAEEKYLKTALDGALGEIVCIGFAIDDKEPESFTRVVGLDDEYTMLQEFFAHTACHITGTFQFVGHNVRSFDLNFLFKRCVINGLQPVYDLKHEGRYNNDDVYDTMLAWAGWGNYVKLEAMCQQLGLNVSKNGMDGSQVWDYVQQGRIDEVAAYCRNDVAMVREAHRRLTFQSAA